MENSTINKLFISVIIIISFIIKIKLSAEDTLTIQECVDLALKNNRQIKIANLNILKTEADIMLARSMYFPKVSLLSNYVTRRGKPISHDPVAGTDRYVGDKNTTMTNLNIYIPLYDFGVRKSKNDQAKKVKVINQELKIYREQEVVYNVKYIFYSLLKMNFLIDTLEQSKRLTLSHLKTVKHFFAEEMVDKNDVLQTELRLASIEQDLISLRNNLQIMQKRLVLLLGTPELGNKPVDDPNLTEKHQFKLKELTASALKNRPEIKINLTAIDNFKLVLKENKSSYYPSLYSSGAYTYNSDEYKAPEKTWNMEVRGQLPIIGHRL